jgi:putative phage-type endonuclease
MPLEKEIISEVERYFSCPPNSK